MATVIEINKLVGTSWFDFDGDIEDLEELEEYFNFTTRENGNVGDETFGQEDWDEGQRLLLLIIETYGHLIESYELTTCDEWVTLELQLKLD